MKKLFMIIVMLSTLALMPRLVFAQEEGEGEGEGGGSFQEPQQPQTIYKKTTVYDFEEDTISGDLTRPDAEYLESRKRARHQSLIQIREDFNDKVIDVVRAME